MERRSSYMMIPERLALSAMTWDEETVSVSPRCEPRPRRYMSPRPKSPPQYNSPSPFSVTSPELADRLAACEHRMLELNAEAATQKAELLEAKAHLRRAEAEVDTLTEKLAHSSERNSLLLVEVEGLRKKLSAAEAAKEDIAKKAKAALLAEERAGEARLAECKRELDDRVAELHRAHAVADELRDEVGAAQAALVRARDELIGCKKRAEADRERHVQEIEMAKVKMAQLKGELGELHNECGALQSSVARDKERSAKEREAELTQRLDERLQMQGALKSAEMEVARLADALAVVERERDSLRARDEQAESALLKEQIAELKGSLQHAEGEIAHLQRIVAQQEGAMEQAAYFKSKLRALEEEFRHADARVGMANTAVLQMREEAGWLQQTNDEKCASLMAKLEATEFLLRQRTEEVTKLQSEMEPLGESLGARTQQVRNLQASLLEAQAQLSKVSDFHESCTARSEEVGRVVKELVEKVSSSERTCAGLREDLGRRGSEMAELQRKYTKLQRKYKECGAKRKREEDGAPCSACRGCVSDLHHHSLRTACGLLQQAVPTLLASWEPPDSSLHSSLSDHEIRRFQLLDPCSPERTVVGHKDRPCTPEGEHPPPEAQPASFPNGAPAPSPSLASSSFLAAAHTQRTAECDPAPLPQPPRPSKPASQTSELQALQLQSSQPPAPQKEHPTTPPPLVPSHHAGGQPRDHLTESQRASHQPPQVIPMTPMLSSTRGDRRRAHSPCEHSGKQHDDSCTDTNEIGQEPSAEHLAVSLSMPSPVRGEGASPPHHPPPSPCEPHKHRRQHSPRQRRSPRKAEKVHPVGSGGETPPTSAPTTPRAVKRTHSPRAPRYPSPALRMAIETQHEASSAEATLGHTHTDDTSRDEGTGDEMYSAALGVQMRFVNGEGTVTNVKVGAPVYRAGVRKGDVVMSLGGKRVAKPSDVLQALASLLPPSQAGSDGELTFVRRRHGEETTFSSSVHFAPPRNRRAGQKK